MHKNERNLIWFFFFQYPGSHCVETNLVRKLPLCKHLWLLCLSSLDMIHCDRWLLRIVLLHLHRRTAADPLAFRREGHHRPTNRPIYHTVDTEWSKNGKRQFSYINGQRGIVRINMLILVHLGSNIIWCAAECFCGFVSINALFAHTKIGDFNVSISVQ